MNQKLQGILVIGLAISLVLNFYIFMFKPSSKNENLDYIEEQNIDLIAENKQLKGDIKELEKYVELKHKKDEEPVGKENIIKFLTATYSYNEKTQDDRYDKVEDIISPELFKSLTTKEGREQTNFDKQEMTVSIKDITIFTSDEDDYLARYTVSIVTPDGNEVSNNLIATFKLDDENKIESWEQIAEKYKKSEEE